MTEVAQGKTTEREPALLPGRERRVNRRAIVEKSRRDQEAKRLRRAAQMEKGRKKK